MGSQRVGVRCSQPEFRKRALSDESADRLAELEARVASLESGRFDLLTLSTGIHVVDQQDRLRLAMRLVEGEPAVKLWGSDGRSGLFLGGAAGTPEVSFTDTDEQIRLKLMLGANSGPTLVLTDENGVVRLSVSVTDGAPRVMLHDTTEAIRVAIAVDDEPNIEIYDIGERPRIALRTDGLAEPLVCTIDSEGHLTGRL